MYGAASTDAAARASPRSVGRSWWPPLSSHKAPSTGQHVGSYQFSIGLVRGLDQGVLVSVEPARAHHLTASLGAVLQVVDSPRSRSVVLAACRACGRDAICLSRGNYLMGSVPVACEAAPSPAPLLTQVALEKLLRPGQGRALDFGLFDFGSRWWGGLLCNDPGAIREESDRPHNPLPTWAGCCDIACPLRWCHGRRRQMAQFLGVLPQQGEVVEEEAGVRRLRFRTMDGPKVSWAVQQKGQQS